MDISPALHALLAAERDLDSANASAATPVVDVTYSTGRDGRQLHVTIALGILLGDGQVAYATEPTSTTVARFSDPDPITTVRWAARRAFLAPQGTIVRYFREGADTPSRTEAA